MKEVSTGHRNSLRLGLGHGLGLGLPVLLPLRIRQLDTLRDRKLRARVLYVSIYTRSRPVTYINTTTNKFRKFVTTSKGSVG